MDSLDLNREQTRTKVPLKLDMGAGMNPRLPNDAVRRKHKSLARRLSILNNSGLQRAMRQIERQQDVLSGALDSSLATRLTELSRATQQVHNLSLGTSLLPNIAELAHVSWLSDIHRASIPSIELVGVAKMVTDISCGLSVTERLFANFDYDFLGRHLDIQPSTMSDVQRSMSDLWASFDGLASSMPSLEDIVQLPSFVLPGATHELSIASHALDVVFPLDYRTDTEIVEPEPYPLVEEGIEDSDLIVLLERVDIQFVTMYRGAVASLDSDNPDRSRHVLTSFRELWSHLLRRLAPKEEVTAWVERNGIQGYLQDGQPTRHAKIRYVLRNLGNPLGDFVEADTRAMVKLYTLYDRLHALDTGVTDNQLRVVTFRTKSYLGYLLRVWEWSME